MTFVGADVNQLDDDADLLRRRTGELDEHASWFRSAASLAGFVGDAEFGGLVGATEEQFDQVGGIFAATRSILSHTRDGLLGIPYNTVAAIDLSILQLELAVMGIEPDEQGSLSAVIAANRLQIKADLAVEDDPDRRRLLQSWLDSYTDPLTGEEVFPQIVLYDGDNDRVAVALGDLDRAVHVAVAVPGTATTPDAYLMGLQPGGEIERALQLRTRMADVSGAPVATIAWLGYDAPGWIDWNNPATSGAGIDGGGELNDFIGSLGLGDQQRVTVLGHSYGSYVVGEALKDGMDVDNVIVMGSPGMGVNHVDDFGLDDDTDVFAMRSNGDPVGTLERFGTAPTSVFFGATRLESEGDSVWFSHSDYWNDANLTQLAKAATDGAPQIDTMPSAGEFVNEAVVGGSRIVEDVVDWAQQPLPDWADGLVDGPQSVVRTLNGTVGTVAAEVTDGAIDTVVDWFTD